MSRNIYQEKPWLKNYPKGIKADIDPGEARSIADLLQMAAKRYGKQAAFTCMGRTLSFRQLDAASRQFACYLRNRLRLARGARVALMLPNVLQYPIALFGVLRAGCVVVNVNPLYTGRELKHQLQDSGAQAIVVFENVAKVFADVMHETQVKHVITTGLGDQLGFLKGLLVNYVVRHRRKLVPAFDLPNAVGFNSALALAAADHLETIDIAPSDLAFLQYTGGTTGVSKGAMLTHANILSNVQQADAWLTLKLEPGQETIITAIPLYHIFALTVNCILFVKLGAHNVLIPDPRDMPGFVRLLSKIPFSVITGVNTLFNGLLHTPGFADIDFSTLRLSVGGGAAVQRPVAEKWQAVTGCVMTEGYGLTETSPACMLNSVTAERFSGAIGLPLPGTEAMVCDDEGAPVALDDSGELWVRGPQVMLGYWEKPAETAKVLTAAGWLKTGDVARMDAQGQFFIVDRKKDMILVSGFNVYPNEVEEVIATHPGVLECAVVGVASEQSGEVVKAVIVRKDPNLSEASIKAHCKEQLTAYKQPKVIEFRKELPKSAVGKILRRELRGTS
jgi:long-chain acyl-CoA synthetase